MDEGRRLRRVCQAANATALRAAFDVSSCGDVRMISKDALMQYNRSEKVLRIFIN